MMLIWFTTMAVFVFIHGGCAYTDDSKHESTVYGWEGEPLSLVAVVTVGNCEYVTKPEVPLSVCQQGTLEMCGECVSAYWDVPGNDTIGISEGQKNGYVTTTFHDVTNDVRLVQLTLLNVTSRDSATYKLLVHDGRKWTFEVDILENDSGITMTHAPQCDVVLVTGWVVSALLFLTIMFFCLTVAIRKQKGIQLKNELGHGW